jgi:predicted PurR-regulated permease PerM
MAVGGLDEQPEAVPSPVRVDRRSFALTGLFVLAAVYSLYFARALLVPIVLALLLVLLLRPLVTGLKALKIPEAIGAALVVLGLVGLLALGTYQLSGPAADWVARAPQSLRQAEAKLKRWRKPVEQVTRTAEQVERAITLDDSTPQVEVRGPSLLQLLFGGTQRFLIGLTLVLLLLYFLLASGDLFLRKAVKLLPRLADKKRAVEIAHETQRQISVYLVTSVAIHTTVGVVVAVAMGLLGLPNSTLWGVVAGLLNFVPYVGPVVCGAVLTLAATLSFENPTLVAAVPGTYYAIHFLESYIATPLIMGRRLMLNGVVVFLGLMFWGAVWGVMGSLLAVPLLAIAKIVCDRIEGLTPIGEFLGP